MSCKKAANNRHMVSLYSYTRAMVCCTIVITRT